MAMLLLIVLLVALVLLAVSLVGRGTRRGYRGRGLLLVALLLPLAVFLFWLALMVFGVGPGLRGM
jgi:hypothetical protein